MEAEGIKLKRSSTRKETNSFLEIKTQIEQVQLINLDSECIQALKIVREKVDHPPVPSSHEAGKKFILEVKWYWQRESKEEGRWEKSLFHSLIQKKKGLRNRTSTA